MSWTFMCGNFNSFICSKFGSFGHEDLEITLFQNRCLAVRSPASSDLCLKLKYSIMSASFRVWPGDLLIVANITSLL
jgi:hypothetical protein